MEQVTQNTNPSTPRDYDKDPIVIEDYNPLFFVLFIVFVGIYLTYLFVVNPNESHNSGSRSFWFAYFIGFLLLPTITFYRYIHKNNRKVILENNAITYREDKVVLEKIDINEIVDIRRTFNDYYRKEQNIHPDHSIRKLIDRILSPMEYIVLIVNKILFHVIKNHLRAYKLFDAILIFTANGRVINILPTTKDEYESVRSYFLEKKVIDIINANVLIKFDYRQEEKTK